MTDGRPPILDIRGLRKSFKHVEVLRGIDLAVLPQELVFIIGPSGSGKSTLLRCCNRLEEPTAGAICVGGVDIMARATDINAIRRQIGMVFQSFNLYPHMTALGNVMLALCKVLGKPRADAERLALAALDRVGLSDKALPPRERAGSSSADRAGARAEPGDAFASQGMWRSIRAAAKTTERELKRGGMTMLVVSHEMRFARDAADRVIFMDHGAIVEQGTPERIFSTPGETRTRAFVAELAG
jgi:polar amino acid transport system ATP-binding protein